MDILARGKFIRVAPRKAMAVADLIRGKGAVEALSILSFTPRAASRIMISILNQAVANAKDKGYSDRDIDSLYIKGLFVDQGPIMRRMQPRAMGRGAGIRKKTSHVTMVLGQK